MHTMDWLPVLWCLAQSLLSNMPSLKAHVYSLSQYVRMLTCISAPCHTASLSPINSEQHCCKLIQVAQTCQLALQRIQYHSQQHAEAQQDESRYLSVDPTPAAPSSTPANELRATLIDESARIFDRYRAMFALRNKGGPDCVEALGDAFASESALLKHEVAYVLGQMQDANAVNTLRCNTALATL